MNPLIHLRESMPDFSATEQRIAAYILCHAEALAATSISTVASECQTSKSMVVQMCKKAGYKGFKDLCNRLSVGMALSSRREMVSEYRDIHPGCPVEQICHITMQKELESLHNTLDILDPERIEAAVDALISARRIRLFGVGNSAVVALDMHNKLQRIGLDSHFSQDTHCQLTAASTLIDEDCALVFSYDGTTRDMIDAVHYALEGGATVISITRYGHNPISDKADIPLYVAANESLVRAAAMSSRLAMLTMVDMLFTCVASKMHGEIVGLLNRTAGIIKNIKK